VGAREGTEIGGWREDGRSKRNRRGSSKELDDITPILVFFLI